MGPGSFLNVFCVFGTGVFEQGQRNDTHDVLYKKWQVAGRVLKMHFDRWSLGQEEERGGEIKGEALNLIARVRRARDDCSVCLTRTHAEDGTVYSI